MLNRYFKPGKENIDFMYANMAIQNIYFAIASLEYILYHDNYDIGIFHDDHTFYFFHIQSVLTACGNISNIFNSTSSKSYARSTRLCKKLNINTAQYPLTFKKELRNTNEHFDERYEEFDCNIGDYNIIFEGTDELMKSTIYSNYHLRTYDKTTNTYYTYNKKKVLISCNLKDLYDELIELRTLITENPLFESGWVDEDPHNIISE